MVTFLCLFYYFEASFLTSWLLENKSKRNYFTTLNLQQETSCQFSSNLIWSSRISTNVGSYQPLATFMLVETCLFNRRVTLLVFLIIWLRPQFLRKCSFSSVLPKCSQGSFYIALIIKVSPFFRANTHTAFYLRLFRGNEKS